VNIPALKLYISCKCIPESNKCKNIIMERRIIGYWDIKKEKLKMLYPGITEDDVTYPEGKEKEMMELLCNKLGKSKQELVSIIVKL
jgi:hypothetical protein